MEVDPRYKLEFRLKKEGTGGQCSPEENSTKGETYMYTYQQENMVDIFWSPQFPNIIRVWSHDLRGTSTLGYYERLVTEEKTLKNALIRWSISWGTPLVLPASAEDQF